MGERAATWAPPQCTAEQHGEDGAVTQPLVVAMAGAFRSAHLARDAGGHFRRRQAVVGRRDQVSDQRARA